MIEVPNDFDPLKVNRAMPEMVKIDRAGLRTRMKGRISRIRNSRLDK
jgi:hypothetical protein